MAKKAKIKKLGHIRIQTPKPTIWHKDKKRYVRRPKHKKGYDHDR